MTTAKTCCTPDCSRPVRARDLCLLHYQRARYHGTLDEVAPRPPNHCEQCGVEIPRGRRWGARFCSVSCKQASYDAASRARTLQRHMARTHSCAWCREPFDLEKRLDARFCSVKCADAWNNHQRSLIAKRAKLAERKSCEVCGKPVPGERSRGAIYCSVECKQLSQRSTSPVAKQQSLVWNLRNKYNLTVEEFNELLASQDGKCAICRTDEWPGNGHRPHVDHCHSTNKVRGALCHDCNLGLGHFKDRIDLLEAAIAYLKR